MDALVKQATNKRVRQLQGKRSPIPKKRKPTGGYTHIKKALLHENEILYPILLEHVILVVDETTMSVDTIEVILGQNSQATKLENVTQEDQEKQLSAVQDVFIRKLTLRIMSSTTSVGVGLVLKVVSRASYQLMFNPSIVTITLMAKSSVTAIFFADGAPVGSTPSSWHAKDGSSNWVYVRFLSARLPVAFVLQWNVRPVEIQLTTRLRPAI
ncbi:hypothetical protein O1611_g7555 [Lasiodiplodia mahajangana]|uniref:Uncharacterized protein n=1 Tax=Lasiodiplodia mahajangana TaxID=1108764 RepID=A0ACC2JF10_9PEZI|nr:hypothetical protein O1611_g7555 [Lasiodiplodia mahajangana]